MVDDADGLESLKACVIEHAKVTQDSSIEKMIILLSTFERVGLKKIPERMQVLKEMKDRIEGDLCSNDELLQVIESYPKTLKNKVS